MKVDGLAEPRSSEPWPLRMYTFIRQSGMPDGTMIGLTAVCRHCRLAAYAPTHQSANTASPWPRRSRSCAKRHRYRPVGRRRPLRRDCRVAEAKMKELGVPGVALGIVERVAAFAGSALRMSKIRCRSRHSVSDRVDLEDLRGDGDHAAGRARQDRPPRAGTNLSA